METPPVQEGPAGRGANPSSPEQRPDLTPQRNPEPLSRRSHKRTEQLLAIAKRPSGEQLQAVASHIKEEDPSVSPKNAEARAKRRFETLKRYASQRGEAHQAVKEARKLAWDQGRGEPTYVRALRRRDRVELKLHDLSNWLGTAGLQIEPDQRPLTFTERAGTKVGEVRWEAGATAGRVARKAEAAVVGVREALGSRVEAGRRSVASLVEAVNTTVRRAGEKGEAGLRQVTAVAEAARKAAQATPEKTAGVMGRLAGRVGEGIGRVAGKAERVVGSGWDAASTFAAKVGAGALERGGAVVSTQKELFDRARGSVAGRLATFAEAMRRTGEAARNVPGQANEAIAKFIAEQGKTVQELRDKAVQSRAGQEVRAVVDRGRERLRPAWESIKRDRERIRAQAHLLTERAALMVEQVGDVAHPVVDRIVDDGRAVRDEAAGLGRKGFEGMRALGRRVATPVIERAVSPAWNSVTERWESMRLRANESRGRLNTFLTEALGKAGKRFKTLGESAVARTERAKTILSGVKVEAGKIVQKGVEAPQAVKELFAQQGTAAAEFVRSRKEQVARGLEALQKFWMITAVGKWKELGMSDKDVSRRLKVMRAASAASLKRVASIGGAAAFEGAILAPRLVRDPRGRLLLGAAALALVLITQHDAIGDFFQSLGASGAPVTGSEVGMADIGGVPDFGVSVGVPGAEAPIGGGVGLGGPDADINVLHVGGVEPAGMAATFPAGDVTPGVVDLEGGLTQPTVSPTEIGGGPGPGPAGETQVVQPVSAAEPGGTPAGGGGVQEPGGGQVGVGEAAGGPQVGGPGEGVPVGGELPQEEIWSQVKVGEPVEPQARALAETMGGNPTENYYNLLEDFFRRYTSNFEATARVIADNVNGTYTPEQVGIAQAQLEAIATLGNSPAGSPVLDASTTEGYNLLMRAMHFWSPFR